jgi:hypothetical protein
LGLRRTLGPLRTVWLCRCLRSSECRAGQELSFEGSDAATPRVACGLFLAQQKGEFAQLQIQLGDRAFALVQAGVEFAFAQGQDVGTDFEVLLLVGGGCSSGFEFELGAAAAFVERLHPEGFGDVGDGFGEAVQGRRP